jgi:iron complex outermembrane receptor protein
MGENSSARRRILVAGAAAIAMVPGLVWAQERSGADVVTTPSAEDPEQGHEIVVTGTLIRGIAPVGNNVIGIGEQQIKSSGATTTNQVLQSLPQLSNYFNQLPIGPAPVAGSNGTNPIQKPNLRNLPGAVTGGGAATLVLIDGHRVVGAGTQQVAVDPDILAPDAIQRVEALTDGGSAVYGSDALGGVLNFITRKRFDGIEAAARYGIGKDYQSFDGSIIAGRDWGSGSAYVSYSYSWHDAIYGIDRGYAKRIDWNTMVPTGRNCAAPTVSVGTATYVVSGSTLTPGGPNTCDASDYTALYPAATLHNVYGKLTQDLTDTIHFDVSFLYANRKVTGNNGPFGLNGTTTGTVTVTATNPNYRSTGGATATANQTVRFNYAPVSGNYGMVNRTDLETWSVTPQVAIDLGEKWQLRTLASYGRSFVAYRNNLIDPAAQTAALNSGKLNPYNVAASDPAALAAILGGIERGDGKNAFFDGRAIIDGTLLTITGGDVRVAFGGEYMDDTFKRRTTNAALVLQPYTSYNQNVVSAFGEVQIPLVSENNGSPLLRGLGLSASARYDKYNDFGDTFNPKFGIDYKPVSWITIKGNWGKSFTAPSPADQLGTITAAAIVAPGQFLSPPPVVPGVCGGSLPACSIAGTVGISTTNGAVAGLQPQKATQWSIGAVIEPPFVPGLRIAASYFAIDLKGTISRPTGTNLTPFYNNFPNLWIYKPSGQQLAAALSTINPANVGFTIVNPTSSAQAIVRTGGVDQPVGVFLDTVIRNIGENWIEGIDFAVNYAHETGFGSVDGSVSGNIPMRRDNQQSPVAPVIDQLVNASHLRLAATLGANIGSFRAQATLYHSAGYLRSDAGSASAFGQVRVKPFDTINLFFKYDVPAKGLFENLSFTLNVSNLFDKNPSVYKNTGLNGYDVDHSQTLGRFFQFGVRKRF